jgi:glutaredoxin 3
MSQVEIYTREWCGYCDAARALLKRKGVPFVEIDVTGDPQRRSEMTRRANGRTTLPQIFVGLTHVGGCDELYELDRAGQLDPLLKPERT